MAVELAPHIRQGMDFNCKISGIFADVRAGGRGETNGGGCVGSVRRSFQTTRRRAKRHAEDVERLLASVLNIASMSD